MKHPLFKTLQTMILSLALLSPVAAEALSSYRADIAVMSDRGVKLRAKGQIEFIQRGASWSLEVTAKGGPLSSRDFSRGDIVDDLYRPLHFTRDVKVLFYKERMFWDYDWNQMRVTGEVQGDDLSYALDGIIHDQISFQIPLRQGLIQDQSQFDFKFFSYKTPKELKFEVIGEELLNIGGGRVHTLMLRQIKPQRSGEKKLIWVATEHDFIPVRLSTFKDDKLKDDVTVTRLWIDDQAVTF